MLGGCSDRLCARRPLGAGCSVPAVPRRTPHPRILYVTSQMLRGAVYLKHTVRTMVAAAAPKGGGRAVNNSGRVVGRPCWCCARESGSSQRMTAILMVDSCRDRNIAQVAGIGLSISCLRKSKAPPPTNDVRRLGIRVDFIADLDEGDKVARALGVVTVWP